MAHLSVPSSCAVSCSPAAFQYLVTVAHDHGRLLTAWWKLCFLFHLFPWYPVLSPRDEPWQGWGLDLCQGICTALCLCTAGTLTAAHFNKGNCSVSVSRGAEHWKKAGSELDTALRWRWFPFESHEKESSDGQWRKCSRCCCWPLCPSRGWGCAAHRDGGCLHCVTKTEIQAPSDAGIAKKSREKSLLWLMPDPLCWPQTSVW